MANLVRPFGVLLHNPPKPKQVQAARVDHGTNKSDKCESKIFMNVGQALLLLIQKSTGKQTHEIMSILISEYEQMLKDYELDPNKKSSTAEWHHSYWSTSNIRKKRTLVFPGTDVMISYNLSMVWRSQEYKEFSYDKEEKDLRKIPANTTEVNININIPRKVLTFETEQINQILMEGELMDFSDNISDLEPKDSILPAVKREKARIRKEISDAKNAIRAEQKAKKQKEDIEFMAEFDKKHKKKAA